MVQALAPLFSLNALCTYQRLFLDMDHLEMFDYIHLLSLHNVT